MLVVFSAFCTSLEKEHQRQQRDKYVSTFVLAVSIHLIQNAVLAPGDGYV